MGGQREFGTILVLLGVVVVAGNGAAAVINAAADMAGRWPGGLELIRAHPFAWSAGLMVMAAGVVLRWAPRGPDRGSAELAPAAELPEPWVVDRPAEVNQVVAALCQGDGTTVGITTALYGAGGFGKTTVAKLIRSDRRVLRRFDRRVFWVTLGRDVRTKEAITDKVNDLINRLGPGRGVTFTDPQQAGECLGALLDAGPRRLVIIDDVWYGEQLAPFVNGGRRCTRLVTTRNPMLVAGRGIVVKVDQLSAAQARELLTWQLPPLPGTLIDALLAETGRWPLLLRLVNKVLTDQAKTCFDPTAAAAAVRDRLRRRGALVIHELTGEAGRGLDIDEPTGEARRGLDIDDPDQRQRAVRATIEASTSLLDPDDRARFAELAIFAEGETIPVALVGRLWRATAGLDELVTEQLCARLQELALLSLTSTADGGVIGIHDVVRDYLRGQLDPTRRATLHGILLDAVAEDLPAAAPLDRDSAAGATAWWKLDAQARYLWEHLVEHLLAADRAADADALAGDLRWVAARLAAFGPVAPTADLALLNTARAARLRTTFAQAAHLLGPTEPTHAQLDVLCSRVAHDPDWGPQAMALASQQPHPRLINRWPLPDLPDPALRRTLTCQTDWVRAVAVAPDGRWLAASDDRTVRIWDVDTGQQRTKLTGHTGPVHAMAVGPDGRWLATASDDQTVRIWDVDTGQQRTKLTGHTGPVQAVVVAPNGRWLATASDDRTVRIWNVATGRQRTKLTGHNGSVKAVAVAPDGRLLATASDDRTVRIWDIATGQQRIRLTGDTGSMRSVAIAPDGRWLTASDHRTVRIWDVATGQQRTQLTGHTGSVYAVAIAPDGRWLATSDEGTVRIWDVATGQQRTQLTGHTDWVNAVAIAPDGRWLATASNDRTVRIWDVETGQRRTRLTGHNGSVNAVAVAQNGLWLASASDDRTVRIWDVATGQQRTQLTGHTDWVNAVAIAPDGRWLAASDEATVRIWDVETGRQRTRLTGHADWVNAVAIAPDGRWLATASNDWTVRIWDVKTGRQRTKLAEHTGPVHAVAIAPDGRWLATSDEEAVRLWDVTGQQRTQLITHALGVHAVAVAPDGRWLATASDDRTVRIWDVATGRQRIRLTGHAGPVNAVAIAPDGRWLATASDDRTVRIWDTAGKCSALMRIDNIAMTCAWTPDGAAVAVGGAGLYLFAFHHQAPEDQDAEDQIPSPPRPQHPTRQR